MYNRTLREFLLDPRGEKLHCAFCQYFEPYKAGESLPDTGYGKCLVPDELVKFPISYRADNEGTAAWHGIGCDFFLRGSNELPDWSFLEQVAPVMYEASDETHD